MRFKHAIMRFKHAIMRFKHAIAPFKHAIMRSKIRLENAKLNHEDCFIRNEIDIRHGIQKPKFDFRLFCFGDLIVKQFFANLCWLHDS